jgi:hypothetical protein
LDLGTVPHLLFSHAVFNYILPVATAGKSPLEKFGWETFGAAIFLSLEFLRAVAAGTITFEDDQRPEVTGQLIEDGIELHGLPAPVTQSAVPPP